jgi:hypothetical protein
MSNVRNIGSGAYAEDSHIRGEAVPRSPRTVLGLQPTKLWMPVPLQTGDNAPIIADSAGSEPQLIGICSGTHRLHHRSAVTALHSTDRQCQAGREAQTTITNQAKLQNCRMMVHNLLCTDQGTGANETMHNAGKKALVQCGGTRNMKTLREIYRGIKFVYNGVPPPHASIDIILIFQGC